MTSTAFDKELDVRGAKCPMPIVKARKEILGLAAGQVLKVISTDPGSMLDFQGWAKMAQNIELVNQETSRDDGGKELYIHFVRRTA